MNSPIAIVGMGCRFPGDVNNPNDFWNLLIQEKDVISDVPTDRWNHQQYHSKDRNTPGSIIAKQGGFIKNINGFDPQFFGIQPNEAIYMDPQQRIALQVTWEAFEQGGLDPQDWRGQAMGVYMGCFTADYQNMQFLAPHDYSIYSSTGMMNTMLSNRISHCFDFCGPSMSIDTACSASMTAVHQACLSLQANESDAAVAGGALLMLLPDLQIAESKTGFLSKDSRCKAFGAEANGYVRSEGVGVIILKRLEDAIKNQNQIQAVIIGSAVNQDGATNSVTLPSEMAQIRVMQKACQKAGVQGNEISFVEAHGTGTSAGDPIEAQSIAHVYRNTSQAGSPLLIGSCKSDIGHTESAAGIAGIIKCVLCLQHGIIPKSLHTDQLNPNIPFGDLGILPAQKTTKLFPGGNQPLIAAVNSFGFGGSNAHIIIQQAPKENVTKNKSTNETKNNSDQLPKYLLPISARSPESLRNLVRLHHKKLKSIDDHQMKDWCFSAAHHRTHHKIRCFFGGNTKRDVQKGISNFLDKNYQENEQLPISPKMVWVFPGMGHLTYGESIELLDNNTVFREMFLRCNSIYEKISGISLIQEIRKHPSREFVTSNHHSHALCFFNQLGIASIWQAIGISPDAVLGHSGGEFASFYFAKVYSLDDCLKIIHLRAQALNQVKLPGAMISLKVDPLTVDSLIKKFEDNVCISSYNSKTILTLSGSPAAINEIHQECKKKSVPSLMMPEKMAFHNEHHLSEYKSNWSSFEIPEPHKPQIQLFSTLTGTQVNFNEITDRYFLDNLLQPVQFLSAVQSIIQTGQSNFLEIAITPKLIQHIGQISPNAKKQILNGNSKSSFVSTLAKIYQKGFDLDWNHLSPNGNFHPLPTYPWQNTRYWKESDFSKIRRLKPKEGELIGYRESNRDSEWISQISIEKIPWLKDHVLFGEIILIGAYYVELALEALKATFPDSYFGFHNIHFQKAQRIELESTFLLRTTLDKKHNLIQFSTTKNLQDNQFQTTAFLGFRALPIGSKGNISPKLLQMDAGKIISGTHFYKTLSKARFEYKNLFCGIQNICQDNSKTLCEMNVPQELINSSHRFHPIVMDMAFQSTLACKYTSEKNSFALEIPAEIEDIRVFQKPCEKIISITQIIREDENQTSANIELYSTSGLAIAIIHNFRTHKIRTSAPKKNKYRSTIQWNNISFPHNSSTSNNQAKATKTLILSDHQGTGIDLMRVLISNQKEYEFIQMDSTNSIENQVNDLCSLLQGQSGLTQVIVCTGLDVQKKSDVIPKGCMPVVSLAKAIRESNYQGKCWFLTQHAQPQSKRFNPYQSAIWGMARTFCDREFQENSGGLIDFETNQDIPLVIQLINSHPIASNQFMIRSSHLYSAYLVPYAPKASMPAVTFNSKASYLVTGAFGSLGKIVSQWLVDKSVKHLILTSSQEAPISKELGKNERYAWVSKLRKQGVRCDIIQVDFSSKASIDSIPTSIDIKGVRGVFFCAGNTDDKVLEHLDDNSLNKVIAPKMYGAWGLHSLFAQIPLEYFVLFSSIASCMPNRGSANYAAANSILDSLAHFRHNLGLPALSINWGAWSTGMVQKLDLEKTFAKMGILCFSEAEGRKVLEENINNNDAQLLLYKMDWPKFLRGTALENHFYSQYSANSLSIQSNSSHSSPQADIKTAIMAELCDILNLEPKEIDPNISLVDLGLDSLSSLVFLDMIHQATKVHITMNELKDDLTIEDVYQKIDFSIAIE